jgi:hypothetical protein
LVWLPRSSSGTLKSSILACRMSSMTSGAGRRRSPGRAGAGRLAPSGAGRSRRPGRAAPGVRGRQPLRQQAGGVGHGVGLAPFVDGQRDHVAPVLDGRSSTSPLSSTAMLTPEPGIRRAATRPLRRP